MAKNTKYEHSAGGCVYKRDESNVWWLVGKHSGYHKWVLPKGLIEAEETPEVTAVREVEEEMGVKAEIVGAKPIHVERYVYVADLVEEAQKERPERRVAKYQESGGGKTKVFKTVDFYLMEWVEGEPKDHDWEMEEAGWFSFEEAMGKLDFEGEKKALELARDKILA